MENHNKGLAFEEHCKNLLQRLGFTHVEFTSASGDQGADILGIYENTRYVFQCKDQKKKQGNRSVQEVIGSKNIYKASRAGVISRSDFTQKALELARKNYCLLIKNSELEDAVGRNESFSSFISNYNFPPDHQIEHDFDVIKMYEEVKMRVGHVPQRQDFDATTLYHIKKKYGGLTKLIQSLSDVPYTKKPDNSSIVKEYKRIRKKIGRTPTLEDIVNHTEFSRNCFASYPFTKLQRECGDRPHIERGIDKEKLIEAYKALQKELDHPPSRKELDQKGKYRSSYYTQQWGTWKAFTMENDIPYFKGTPAQFTKEELVVMYLLVNKLLEIRCNGTPPDTWAIRHNLLFNGERVISQRKIEYLFKKADHFKQALESDDTRNLKQTLDDLIRKYTENPGQ